MLGTSTALKICRRYLTSVSPWSSKCKFCANFANFTTTTRNCVFARPLGQGAFGEVFQGVYKYRRNEEHPIAVKTIPLLTIPQSETDFMMEALIMSKFNHPNIVHFTGVSFERNPKYIVLELLAGGNLKNFLREERPRGVNSPPSCNKSSSSQSTMTEATLRSFVVYHSVPSDKTRFQLFNYLMI